MMWEKIHSSNLLVEATTIIIPCSLELVAEPQQQSLGGISNIPMQVEWTIMRLQAAGVHTASPKISQQEVLRLTW